MATSNKDLLVFNKKHQNILRGYSSQIRAVIEMAFREGWKAGTMAETVHTYHPDADTEKIPNHADPLITSVDRWRR